MEARTPEGSEAGAKRAAGSTLTTGSAGKRVCPSGSGAAAGATSEGATSKSDICQHQRIRSTCKECREEADTSMPAGLEELAGPAHAAGKDL